MGSPPLGLPASATVLALLFLLGCAGVATADCSVPLKQLSERPPLLLRPGGPLNVSGFAAPDADHVVRLSTNASLLLACPGPGNQLLFAKRTSGYRQVNVTCARDSVVTVRGEEVDLRTVQCLRHAERTAEKDGKRRCGAGARGVRMRIGFRLLTGFLELVAACFDDQLLSPIYSNYTLGRMRRQACRSDGRREPLPPARSAATLTVGHGSEKQIGRAVRESTSASSPQLSTGPEPAEHTLTAS
ncbi:Protein of unknown function [Gryllus bimaculatus]|nr:Protein of unknown function [Gryllus bimaculatus]